MGGGIILTPAILIYEKDNFFQAETSSSFIFVIGAMFRRLYVTLIHSGV